VPYSPDIEDRLEALERKLDRLLAAVEDGSEPDALLDVKAACERLGIGRTKLNELVAERHIRPVRIGRAVRIPTAQIRALIRHGTT
jgi:excisionase family DNA binding protein